MKILLVEDDSSLAKGLTVALTNAGFTVNCVNNGQAALHVVQVETPDMVVLDLGLPDMDGLDVLRKIRTKKIVIPILILTARGDIEERVKGLDNGADDYLTKPFDIMELVARLRVMERRLGALPTNTIDIGRVSLDTKSQTVTRAGEPVECSRREYMLLKALMENAGKIQTREHLENQLYNWGQEISSNAVEVHIHHLRKKLGNEFIKTVRGVGYTIKRM